MSRNLYALILFVIVLSFLAVIYLPSFTKYQELRRQEKILEENIETLQSDNEKLMEEERLLQSDVKYLEKVLREDMGLVKPGEVVYKLVRDKNQQNVDR